MGGVRACNFSLVLLLLPVATATGATVDADVGVG